MKIIRQGWKAAFSKVSGGRRRDGGGFPALGVRLGRGRIGVGVGVVDETHECDVGDDCLGYLGCWCVLGYE